METNLNLADGFSRRQFIEKLAYGAFGVSILNTALGETPVASIPQGKLGKAKHVIYIYMNGGMSHLDTFDPKTNTEINGGITGISTTGDYQIASYFPKLAQHGNKFSVLRSMTSRTGAHEQGQYLMRTSYAKNNLVVHPAMGAIASWQLKKQHASLPDNVLISGDTEHPREGYLDKKFTPLPIVNPNEGLRYSKASVAETTLNNRLQLMKLLDRGFVESLKSSDVNSYVQLYSETVGVMNSKDLDVFNLNKEDPAVRDRYGRDNFGQGVLLAKRLVQSGVRFVEVDYGGWDNHVDIADRMETRAPVVDQALASLFEDLHTSGLLSSTLVVIATEFGRTPIINVNAGRDHFPAAFSAMIGGLDIGGKAIGKTDDKASSVIDRPIQIGELNATIGHFLGIKHDFVYMSPQGRPFTTGNKEVPIRELL